MEFILDGKIKANQEKYIISCPKKYEKKKLLQSKNLLVIIYAQTVIS
jgi:hypothetical protein